MNNKFKIVMILGLFAALLHSCKDEETVGAQFDDTPYTLNIRGFSNPSIAADNPLTEQGVKLGKMLFYETMLSKDGSMSCASCHRQEHAFTDTAQLSTGVRGMLGGRQAMTIFNMAWHTNEFFWDGRAHLLRDQSLMPIQDELEMDETLDNVVAKLTASQMYKDQFTRAFGSDEITSHKMSLAMEQFMNSITSNNAKYDRYLAGKDSLTASEERGRELFFTEYNAFFPEQSGADCAHCHSGDNFSNNLYMNNGLKGDDRNDQGRFKVTENPEDKGKFKVTSLRNIAVSGPYMHDGSLKNLHEVVQHYNNGLVSSATIDPALEQTRGTGLMLSPQDIDDIVAFLHTLTDQDMLTNPEYADPF